MEIAIIKKSNNNWRNNQFHEFVNFHCASLQIRLKWLKILTSTIIVIISYTSKTIYKTFSKINTKFIYNLKQFSSLVILIITIPQKHEWRKKRKKDGRKICSPTSLTFYKIHRHLEPVRVVVAIVEDMSADSHAGHDILGVQLIQRVQHRLQRLHPALRHHRPAR